MADHTIYLSDNPNDFWSIAENVQAFLKGTYGRCADGLDQSYWDLHADGGILMVHREHYLGVCVYCDDDPKSLALLERVRTSVKQLRPKAKEEGGAAGS
jgi:hypothetical protein